MYCACAQKEETGHEKQKKNTKKYCPSSILILTQGCLYTDWLNFILRARVPNKSLSPGVPVAPGQRWSWLRWYNCIMAYHIGKRPRVVIEPVCFCPPCPSVINIAIGWGPQFFIHRQLIHYIIDMKLGRLLIMYVL